MRHGGVTGRPGTMYVGTTQNAGAAVRLIPFIFNETGNGQSYVLEFGNQYIAFYQNGGVVSASPPTPYTISSPYLQADLADLQFAQSADVITIVHRNYAPRQLSRISATNWTLSTINFSNTAQALSSIVVITGTSGSGNTYTYLVTSIDATTGDEIEYERAIALGQVDTGSIGILSATNIATLNWGAAPNAAYYKVYRSDSNGDTQVLGFIGQSADTGFTDAGYTPDFTNAPPRYSSFGTPSGSLSAGNYPGTVGFLQQRRGFGATTNNPVGFWLSHPGSYSNFAVHLGFQEDSDAIIGALAGEEVNQIQFLMELKFALMLTTGAEIYLQGDGTGVLKPSAINASAQSQYGASSLKPLKVGDVLLFNQSLGSFIRDFAFDFAIDGYRGNDVTVFSSHLFEGYSLSDWTFQKIPDSIIWAVRSDGTLLSCTYLREQQILAWAHHDFTNGTVENVCAIPENGNYALYLSIKRVINGATVRYIERLSSRIWQGSAANVAAGMANALGDPIDATYLDCYGQYDGRNQSTLTILTLTASGAFQTDSTAYQQVLTLNHNSNGFSPTQVGKEYFLYDAEFISSQGKSGHQVRLIMQSYISPSQMTCTPDSGAVPVEFQNVGINLWAVAVKTVAGLDYLEGQEVSVWADRFVVGSPLNANVTSTYTVSGGSITLDKCYAVIYVGLPMVQDMQSLDQENAAGASMLAKRKRTGKVSIYTYMTRSLFAGSQDPDTNEDNEDGDYLYGLEELMRGHNRETYDEPPELLTTQDWVTFDTRWNYGGRIFIRNVDPLPMSILSWAPEGEDPAQSPMYKKV